MMHRNMQRAKYLEQAVLLQVRYVREDRQKQISAIFARHQNLKNRILKQFKLTEGSINISIKSYIRTYIKLYIRTLSISLRRII